MAFSKEQSEEVKKQLLQEVDKLPNENKEQIKEYIKNLDETGLEEFLKKNNIKISDSQVLQDNVESDSEQKCILCSIAQNLIPSYKIAQNKKAIAILELNPLSKAHSIVIPLEHLSVEKLPKSALSLASKITKKIKKKFKPEDIKIETSSFAGHAMINIIPMYKNTPLKKIKADDKDLKFIQSKLIARQRAKRKQEKVQQPPQLKKQDLSKLQEISFRIP